MLSKSIGYEGWLPFSCLKGVTVYSGYSGVLSKGPLTRGSMWEMLHTHMVHHWVDGHLWERKKTTGFYAASTSKLSLPLLETCMRPTGHVCCLHCCVLYLLLRYWYMARKLVCSSFPEGYWSILLLGQRAFVGRLGSGHLYESAWIGRVGQGAPQASDHCLMSTSSAAG